MKDVKFEENVGWKFKETRKLRPNPWCYYILDISSNPWRLTGSIGLLRCYTNCRSLYSIHTGYAG